MKNSKFWKEGFHGIDDVEEDEAVGRVVKSDIGAIEYLFPFHGNITYAPMV